MFPYVYVHVRECIVQYAEYVQDEAIVVYNRMNQGNSDLLDSVRNDPNTRPPFFWHHIRPERQRWGIMEISRNAGPLTRTLFERGNTTGEYGPNWVAGWLLYSVFRSRDVRNNRNRRKGDDHGRLFEKQYQCNADSGQARIQNGRSRRHNRTVD